MSNASDQATELPNLFNRQHAIHGGPVTSATIRFPPPTHATITSHQQNDRAKEYHRLKSQGRVVLSRGGWIESHPLCPASNHDSAVYKSLAFGNNSNRGNDVFEAVSGMLFPSSAASLSYLNEIPTTAGDPNGDFDANNKGCSGRVPSQLSVVSYGGRRLSFLSGGGLWNNSDKHGVSEKDEFSLIPITANPTHTDKDYLEVSDWIHDISLLDLDWRCSANKQSDANEITCNAFILALGMVNNNCEIWGFRTATSVMHNWNQKDRLALMATRLQCISCDVRCMTYSLSFHGWHKESHTRNIAELPCLVVASGTVFGEIIVWGAVNESNNSHILEKTIDRWLSEQIAQDTALSRLCVPSSFRLKGHHGSVFSVKFGSSGEIASTSDDRTVRLWALTPLLSKNDDYKSTREILQSQSTHSYKLIWTGWGHTARVWEVSFASLPTLSSRDNSTVLVSSGEDGVARIWNPPITEKELRRPFRGHRCESVWTVNICEGIVVTGANDGSVKLFDLESSLANDGAKTYIVPLIESAPTANITHTTPEAQDAATATKNKKRKTKIKSRMIDMQFYNSSVDRATKLLVAARDGSLFSLDLETEIWHTHSDWSREVTSHASGEIVEIDPSSGSCLAVHPSGGRAVLGTAEGLLVSSDITGNGDMMSSRNSTFNTTRHGEVQSLRWHDNDLLVVFCARGTIICYMFEDVPKLMHVMRLDTAGIPLSSAYDNRDFYVGDSRGNIAHFSLSNLLGVLGNNDMLNEMNPCSMCAKVHAREHVTAIVVSKSTGSIVSVGNDGYVHQCRLDDSGNLHKVFSIPVAGVTGLRNIWLNDNSFIVGGYYGNDFVISNIQDGYEFFRVPTGGRQRRNHLMINSDNVNFDTTVPNAYAMAVCTGHSSIEIHSVSSIHDSIQFSPCIGCTLHGETINKLCWVEQNGSSRLKFLLCGSNDCTVKLTKFVNNQIVSVIELPPHESCVRGVCSSCHPRSNSSLLVTCGGKLSLEFYLLAHMPRELDDSVDVSFLCSYRTLESASIDHRMNVVKAIPLPQTETSHLVVAADSDGDMHLIIIAEGAMPRRTIIGHIIQGTNRPILSLDLVECLGGKILAFVGDTAGDINVWDLSLCRNDCIACDGGSAVSMLFTVKAHSSGVNDLSVAALTQTESQEVILCSVGDDQHLSIYSFVFTKNTSRADGAIELSKTRSIVSQSSSTSSSKAVKVVNENSLPCCFVYTSGSDQCVKLWCLELSTFVVTRVAVSSIETEGSCIDCTRMISSTEQVQVAIGGEGIELQRINYSTFKAAQQLYNADYLLITAGAGFSADSGLSTYECAPVQYKELCDPSQLIIDADRFQRFWLNFTCTYKKSNPHIGYHLLDQWMGLLPKLLSENWWVYTSNVDGHFRRFESFRDRLCEIHGSADEYICSCRMGYVDGKPRFGKEWEHWNQRASHSKCCKQPRLRITDDEIENIINKLQSNILACDDCQLPLRPAVLMFNDTDDSILKDISIHRHRYQSWESQVEEAIRQESRKFVILELGCGTNVPAVRLESEEVLLDCSHIIESQSSKSKGSVCLVRINPKHHEMNDLPISAKSISIGLSAKTALEEIDIWLRHIKDEIK